MARQFDFIAREFGFGPVSKAVAVARSIRKLSPGIILRLLGNGHVLSFGRMAQAFDELIECDLESDPAAAAALTKNAEAVLTSLDFAVVPSLAAQRTATYLIDSLGWLWQSTPPEVAFCRRYYVQGYLLNNNVGIQNSLPKNASVVAPIIDHDLYSMRGIERDTQFALISFAGCCNPFVSEAAFAVYVRETTSAIVDAIGDRYQRIAIYANEKIASFIRTLPEAKNARVAQAEHRRFLSDAARCGVIYTTPGLTTTLECLALGTPLKFLPPNNFSQVRILDIYAAQGALSYSPTFSNAYSAPALHADQDESVAVKYIGEILNNLDGARFRNRLSELFHVDLESARLRKEIEALTALPHATGFSAKKIAEEVLYDCDKARA